MAEYMLSVNDKRLSSVPLQGTITPAIPEGDNGRGSLIVRAIYSDKGAGDLPALTTEAMTVLRSPRLGPQQAEIQQGIMLGPTRGAAGAIIPRANSHIGYKGLDLTGVSRLELMVQAAARGGQVGGTIEVRLDSPTGPVIGQVPVAVGGGRGGPTATEIQAAGGAAPARRLPRPVRAVRRAARWSWTSSRRPASTTCTLLFKNPQATTQPLMSLGAISLIPILIDSTGDRQPGQASGTGKRVDYKPTDQPRDNGRGSPRALCTCRGAFRRTPGA